MSNPMIGSSAEFMPLATDSMAELLHKAKGMLAWITDNEPRLRKLPTGAVDERRALWQPLAELISKAISQPELETDARLEALRVGAEEMRHSALETITMCVHCRSDAAMRKAAGEPNGPKMLADLIAKLELARPTAMKVLGKEDLDALRENGFLRPGE